MKTIFLMAFAMCALPLFAQNETLTINEEELAYRQMIDSINQSHTFQTGTISLGNDLATITVPTGFKYLDPEQSSHVLTNLWGNPPEDNLGMLFPENSAVIGELLTYAVEITYSEEGYIDDEDAKDLDYDDLLESMQEDMKAVNSERIEMGYPKIEMVGWAAEPFYDEQTKKLHWAKELNFDDAPENTLNYNIRILGRKGYLNLNAISEMDQLPLVKANIDKVIGSTHFNEGYRYEDFNPDMDEVAAYGVGGLIAGKVLAKAGFFAAILKFWKVIALGAVGLFGVLRKKLFGSS